MLTDQTVVAQPQHLNELLIKLQQLRELASAVEIETLALLAPPRRAEQDWERRWVQILRQHPEMSWDDAYPGAD